MDWETGIEFGRALERLASHEARIAKVEEDIRLTKIIAARATLVVLLWAFGIIGQMSSERIGETMADLLKALLKG